MALDQDAARETIEKTIAGPLGTDVVEAASGIFRIANKQHVQRRTPRDGRAGAGSARFRDVRLRRSRCDSRRSSGPGSRDQDDSRAEGGVGALSPWQGNQVSNFKITKVQSFIRRTSDVELDGLNEVFAEMLARAEADLGAQEKVRETSTARYIDIRYVGQTHEVTVPIRSRTRRVTAAQPEHGIQRLPRSTRAALRFQTTRATERGADAQTRSDRRPRNRPAPLRAVWRRGPLRPLSRARVTCTSRKAPSSSKRRFTTEHWSSPGT